MPRDDVFRVARRLRRLTLEPGWDKNALCRHHPEPDMWYPTKLDRMSGIRAMRICRGCPVRMECLAYAISRGETHGIWGGMTKRRRDTVARILGSIRERRSA